MSFFKTASDYTYNNKPLMKALDEKNAIKKQKYDELSSQYTKIIDTLDKQGMNVDEFKNDDYKLDTSISSRIKSAGNKVKDDFELTTKSTTPLGLVDAVGKAYNYFSGDDALKEQKTKLKKDISNYTTKQDNYEKQNGTNITGMLTEASPYVVGGFGAGVGKGATLGARTLGTVGRNIVADGTVASSLNYGYDDAGKRIAKEVALGVPFSAGGQLLSEVPYGKLLGLNKTKPNPEVKNPIDDLTDEEKASRMNSANTEKEEFKPTQSNKINELISKIRSKRDFNKQAELKADESILNKSADDASESTIKFGDREVLPLEEVEGYIKSNGENVGDAVGSSTVGLRNATERARNGNVTPRSQEITNNAQKYLDDVEGENSPIIASNAGHLASGVLGGGINADADSNKDGIQTFEEYSQSFLTGMLGGTIASKMTAKILQKTMPKTYERLVKKYAENSGGVGMFVGAKPTDKGAFSDIATKKTMREIDDAPSTLNKYQQGVDDAFNDVVFDARINGEDAKADKIMKFAQDIKGKTNDEAENLFNKKFDEIAKLDTRDKEKLFDEIDAIGHVIRRAKDKPYGKLSDYLNHKELFEKYPDLKDYTVQWKLDGLEDGARGSFSAKNNMHGNIIKLDAMRPRDEIKSTLLHEIQHAIQSKEGWAKGGNTKMFEKTPYEIKQGEWASIIKSTVDETNSEKQVVSEIMDDITKNIDNKDYDSLDVKVLSELKFSDDVKSLLNKWSENSKIDREKPFDKYQRLHGEQQARSTQARMNYTPEQRASEDWTKTLEKTEGKYDKPIIKYDDGVAMSEPKGLLARTQAKIDKGIIPEKGRRVQHPRGTQGYYYLGDSGKVWFEARGKWFEMPNKDVIEEVNYIAKNGLKKFKEKENMLDEAIKKASIESEQRELKKKDSYKMDHKAPDSEHGVGASNLKDAFGDDIYTKNASRYYGHGNKTMDEESIKIIQSVKNKPDAEVTIYRAIPKDINAKINPDDWVTTSKTYAKEHGEGPLDGNYKILEMKVKAKDLYTDGNSIHEWGWSPKGSDDGMIAMSSPELSGGAVGAFAGINNDLDGDGKITWKDIAIGAVGGAGATKAVRKLSDSKIGEKSNAIFKKVKDSHTVDSIIGHKIYGRKDYMGLREKMISAKNAKMEDYVQLHEQLKLLSDDTRKAMYDYMSGKKIQLTPQIKQLADNYKNQINKTSQELVDLGIIEQAQANKFKDKYLHRVYEKDLTKAFGGLFRQGKTIKGVHSRGNEWNGSKADYDQLAKDGKLGDFFDGKIEATKMQNGQYKFRQDWTDEQRARWGEVEDIAYSLPETLMRMNEMSEHGKMLKGVLDTEYVIDEAVEGYTQLQGKRFGALNGKYVPDEVAEDIKEFGNVMFGEEGQFLSSKAGEVFTALSTFWKKSHTVYNPTAHVNNLMSNVTMQFMEGINPAAALRNAKHGAEAYQKLGQYRVLKAKEIIGLSADESSILKTLGQDEDLQLYLKAEKSGLFGRSKLNDILGQYANPSKTRTKTGMLNKIEEKASSLYQGEDNIMRFSLLKALTTGKNKIPFEDAIKRVNNTIPDYTKPMSKLAKIGRKTMLTPFISWTYYSTPIILRQLKERPGRAVALMGALYGINQLAGIDPYNNKDIPQQNFSMKRIPIYKNGSTVTTIKVDRWIPHNEIMSPHDFVKNLTNLGAWGGAKGLLENKHPYYGGKISYNEGLEKAYDLSKYGVSQISPDILDKVGGLVESKVLSEKKRTKNPVIKPRTTTEEIINTLGLNVLSYNKNAQKRKAIKEELKK